MNRFNATRLRRVILTMAYTGQTVHIGCAFSIVELLAVIYSRHLNLDPHDLNAADRDYLVLSKGHGVMAQYACLYELGILSDEAIAKYFRDGTSLKGLADVHVPGVEASTGSLGHGLSVAAGLALAAKFNGTAQTCYAVVGDGELNEGAIWEAVMFARHFKLDNLIVAVDKNGFQAMGSTEDVMAMDDIALKFTAFGFDTAVVDGHNEAEIDAALTAFKALRNGKPKVLVANSVKGRGVSFMEGNNEWHYTRLTLETYTAALEELGA